MSRNSISVVEVMPGIWLASYLHYSCIGNSFSDAVRACWLEAGLPV